MKAYVEAYGCTLNFGESREIEELLAGNGWDLVDDPSVCDLAVLVTCVVIDTTERAMLKRVKELSETPEFIITGCMATACRDKAEHLAPHAKFVAPGDFAALSKLLGPVTRKESLSNARGPYSIVPIATGCKGKCSYCITRFARGELRSRPVSQILEAIERAASDGPREIQLTAQDTASFGADIGEDLPSLVRRACVFPLDFRIRIGMMNPKSALPMSDRLAEMYLEPKVFKFLHLPVQSASDRLLEDMERGYAVEDFKSIVDKVRAKVPDITFSTDLIIGYPGETEEDHRLNLKLVSEIKPDIVNVTRFSPRPGTKAAKASHQVVGWKAKDRSREITELRFDVALEKNRLWVGKDVTALSTEMGKSGTTILRNDEYKQIVVPEVLPLGRYFEIKVTEATPTYLLGKRAGLA